MTSSLSESSGILEKLVATFSHRTSQLTQVALLRNVPAGDLEEELAALDSSVNVVEAQLRAIKERLMQENEALPKAKALVQASIAQQIRLKQISKQLPPRLPGMHTMDNSQRQDSLMRQREGEGRPAVLQPVSTSLARGNHAEETASGARESGEGWQKDSAAIMVAGEPQASTAQPPFQEKKSRGPPPRDYVTVDELASLSSYMRGRLTLDKINAAVDELASFAEANAKLLAAPKKKLSDEALKRALELREISGSASVKGRHFVLESDLKGGNALKMDNTGRGILTVLRHLGRATEARERSQRVIIVSKS